MYKVIVMLVEDDAVYQESLNANPGEIRTQDRNSLNGLVSLKRMSVNKTSRIVRSYSKKFGEESVCFWMIHNHA